MNVTLFITCYNGTLFPETGRAAVEVLKRFLERLHDYGIVTRRVAGELAAAITVALRACGADRLVIPADYPAAWCPSNFTWLRDEGLSWIPAMTW